MPTRFQIFKKKFFDSFILQREFKNIVVTRNLKLLLKITPVIFSLSLFMFVFSVFTYDPQNRESFDYLVHYMFMSASSLFIIILSFCFSKIKKISKTFYNIPVLLNFIGLEIDSYLTFVYGANHFNAIIIFVCVATIIPLVFAIEPLYYITALFVTGAMMLPKVNELYGITSVYNSIVYLGIMSLLALNRWFSIKKNILHDFKAKEREKQIQKELDMAALVQKSYYQHNLTVLKGWNIAYYNDPMISLSGDLFDFYVSQDVLEGLSIFDVSGHGLASGLVTMLVKNTIEEEFYKNTNDELNLTMKRINERVCMEKGSVDNYLTGIILRFSNGKIEMSNAGHPTPVIYRAATGKCEYFKCDLKDRQGVIGLTDFDFEFGTVNVDLEVNDRLILYTDGITEAKNLLNHEYGNERFLASAQRHCNLGVQEQMTAIIKDIKEFIGTAPRTDDISIIILEKK